MADARAGAGKRTGFFYGYWIVFAAFTIFFVTSACSFYSFGLFVSSLEKELGWTRSEIMVANTLLNLVQGIGSVFVGRVIARRGIKPVITGGMVIVTLCFASLANTGTLWQFYLSYALAGLGLATTYSPASALILNWFHQRRGFYVGIAGIGLGLAGVVAPLLLSGLIIPAWGWRAGYLSLGLMAGVIVIPVTLLLVKEKPAEMGLMPYGYREQAGRGENTPVAADGLTTREALHTGAFWLISISGIAYSFATQAITLNQVPYMEDIGYPILTAAGALGAVGVGSAIGKFLFGILCDSIGSRWSRVIGLLLQLGAVAILLTIGADSAPAVIWVYAGLLGLGLGSWVPTQTLQVSSNLGIRDYVTIASLAGLSHTLGGAVGPLFAAYIHDTRGSYTLAFQSFAVLFAVAAIATLLTRRPASYQGTEIRKGIH